MLLSVAVIDDLGAMTVMAVSCSDGVQIAWPAVAVACPGGVALLDRLHVRHILPSGC